MTSRSQRHKREIQGVDSAGYVSGGGGGGGGGGSGSGFQAETDAIIAAFASAPTAARKRTIDRTVRRLKTSGLWAKARWLMFVGADKDATWTNWKTPTEKAIEVGSVTFAADQSYAGALGLNYLNLGIKANALTRDNCGVYTWVQTGHMNPTVAQTGSILGALDASNNGISMVPLHTSTGLNARIAGAAVTSLGTSEGFGLHGASRTSSSNITGHLNGVGRVTSASTSVALPAVDIYIGGVNSNGTIGNGNVVTQSFLYLGEGMTEAENRTLTGIVGAYLENIRYGEYYTEEPGLETMAVTADFAVYGLTGPGVMAAVAYKRARPADNVIIVGGWRDRWTFGMAGGGLGYTDFEEGTGLGGLPRWVVSQCNLMEGRSDVASGVNPTAFKFLSKRFNRVMKNLLATYGIKVYQTNGVTSVAKTAKVITSIGTTDGRTITAPQWHDASYELDLYRLAGLTYKMGREAAGANEEGNNGVRSVTASPAPADHADNPLIIDPWKTPGVTASGLCNGVQVISSTFTPALHNFPVVGTADSLIPAYNFRLTFTTNIAHKISPPQVAPAGYDVADYEIHLRWIAAAAAAAQPLMMADIFKLDTVAGTTRYDVNNSGTLSTDMIYANQGYPTMTYAQREVIWKKVWNYTLGLFYLLQYSGEARVPAALQSESRQWAACTDHYYSPHENDQVFEQPQLYVRECIRAVSDIVMTGAHMNQVDGATPTLGNKTVSVASYDLDSHAMWRVAYESAANVWQLRSEGGMLVPCGGTNNLSPLPYGVFVPKVAECSNLTFSFGGSFTHCGFGASRMELTAMQTGYSMGWANALARGGDGIVQNVDYPTLRTALLASPVLSGEVAPALPQLT